MSSVAGSAVNATRAMLRAACAMARRTAGSTRRRLRAHLVGRHFEGSRHRVEPPCETRERAIAAMPHRVDDRLHAPFEGAVIGSRRCEQPADRPCVAGFDDPHS